VNPCPFRRRRGYGGQAVVKYSVFRRFSAVSKHQLLLLMQRILAFWASFVDMGRAFVKFPTLHFGGIPRAKLKAQQI
jgi:hypothetical protein